MLTLALDTTGNIATAAVTDNEKLLGRFSVRSMNTHSQILLPMIDSLLRSLSLTAADMDVLACSAGPGSFTGVRIGAATLKGLAFGSSKSVKCVGVSSLEALASNLDRLGAMLSPILICPVMDARRTQLYTSLFQFENGVLTRIFDDLMITAAELEEKLTAYMEASDSKNILFVGDGCGVVRREIHMNGMFFAPEQLASADAYAVALCAQRRIARDPDADYSAEKLAPTYLRKSQAERELEEKLAQQK